MKRLFRGLLYAGRLFAGRLYAGFPAPGPGLFKGRLFKGRLFEGRLWRAAVPPPARSVWLAAGGVRTWLSPGSIRYWAAGNDMALVSNVIEEEAGFSDLSLGMDFGDLPEVKGGAAVASCTVAVPAGVTRAAVAVESNGYRVSALFACNTPGTYAVVFTATLDTTPAAVVVRTGTLTVL